MKILIFSTAYLPFVGGAELAIKEITDRLPGSSFTLITARFKRTLPVHEWIGNVEVYRVGHGCMCDKWLLPFRAFRLAKKLEKHVPFDVVWSMMASQASVAAAWFKKAFPEKKLVLTLQEGDAEEHLKRYVFGNESLYRLLIRPWHVLVFTRADVITAISTYLAERGRKNLPAPELRQAGNPNVPIAVVPNGVDIDKFKVESSKLKVVELRQKLGFGEQDKIIVTASRLVAKNAVGDIIAAFKYLPEHVKLLILGSGPLLKSLQLTTYNLQLAGRVVFAGEVPHSELPPYLWASDVFVRPSRSEGMGSAFVEAMAAGLPVIATPVGGIVDFLNAPLPDSAEERFLLSDSRELANRWRNKITGLFCKVGDPKGIAERVQLLLSNEEWQKRIIENAARMVREKYEWNGIAEKMNNLF